MQRPITIAGVSDQSSSSRSRPGEAFSVRRGRERLRGRLRRARGGARSAGVELEHPRERVDHLLGRVPVAALLEAHVVVRAHPASIASSSRRRPGTRRRPWSGRPTSSGVTSSRRARRKSPSRLSPSMSERLARLPDSGGPCESQARQS